MRPKSDYVYDGKLFEKQVGTPVFNYKSVIRYERISSPKRKTVNPIYGFAAVIGFLVFLLLLVAG